MRRGWIACALALGLSGCQTAASNAPYGPYPSNYKDQIEAWFRYNLKDPQSVQVASISPPVQADTWVGLLYGGSIRGYASCVIFNAKNSFGGYVGNQPHTFVFRDAQLVHVTPGC